MKMLLIFVIGVLLTSCGSKKAGNTNGGSNGGPTVPLPTVSIATDLANITTDNLANFTVSGSCSEEGQPITVVVGEGEEDLSPETAPTCTSSGTWSAEIDLTNLTGPSREVSITADHASSGGQSATQATGSTLLHPRVFIATDLANITAANAANFMLSGTCSENGQPITLSVEDLSPETAPTCTDGAWTTEVDVTGLNKMEEVSVTAIHASSDGATSSEATGTVTNEFTCLENYVGVPALADYTTNSFCVMKYEAKSDGSDTDADDDMDTNNAVSQAAGLPYVNINRADSITKCTGLNSAGEDKYDLITNDEWQSIARNIELVGDNWATGVIGNAGGLSRGHSDGSSSILAASSDDTKGCEGTEQNCSNMTWNGQRRTHTLSNGEVIWDIAGNVHEWVSDHNQFKYDSNASISQVTATSHPTSNSLSGGTTTTARNAKAQFGPIRDYTNLDTLPNGNLGYGFFDSNGGGVYRGGSWNGASATGVFAVSLTNSPTGTNDYIGFRCVFHP